MTAPTFEVIQSGNALVLAPEARYVTETPTGLRFEPETPIEVWGALVERLTRQHKRIEWAATRRQSVVKLQVSPGNVGSVPRLRTTRLFGSRAMPRKYRPIVPGALTKECGACHQVLSMAAFGTRRASPDGHSRHCKPCLKQPHIVQASKLSTIAYRQRRRSELNDLKRGPCLDCGGSFPTVCMQFDHRDPSTKKVKVSFFASCGGTTEAFLAEVAKCDLVCANCHAVRTERRRLERLEQAP